MFKTKKQLKEKIKRLEWDIEGLKISKDITISVAESETRNAKAVANCWKTRFENVEKIIKENENLKEALKKEKDWSSIVNAHNDVLNKEIKNLNNYIKKLEEKIVKQGQIIKDKDEYISILHDDATLYTTIKTKLQNSQLKDKLDRISAILNED